ncbi:MAG: response regulator [Deltaproteobacteria bacterium]|nr:MAG: response regulator [Deltaproteobacteria bacterium]
MESFERRGREDQSPSPQRVGLRVLLVDDDAATLKLLTDFLEREGLTVVSVGDALQAIDALSREDFDMVVTDYNMPMVTGEQLLRTMKALPGGRDIPVIVVSAVEEPGLEDRLLRQGAAFFLRKPVDFDQLLALLRFAGA